MSPISRGFHRRRGEEAPEGRVPPGQYVTHDFPVLSAGPTPHTPLTKWTFSIGGASDGPKSWTWQEFQVRGIRLRDEDEPGFWEMYGYNMYGDPWREQRYAGD
jgi:DMSO/TMAO reductase YedYZ molybdopterin-dependent catalytic subunit